MHPDVITHLRCPVCFEPLTSAERVLHCPLGHSFDLARQGYVDLTAGHPIPTADTPEMVDARGALLGAGHFAPLSAAIAAVPTATLLPGPVVDVGAGTAHYLAEYLGNGQQTGIAIDTSKAALKRAARAHPRIGAVRADIWQGLPLADACAAVILDVFSPRAGDEFARVLHPDGVLIVATPAEGHLAELVAELGLIRIDPAKRERLHKTLDPWFTQSGEERIQAPLTLPRHDALALVGMGPSAWHTDPTALAARLEARPEPIPATMDVDLTIWRPRR